MTLPTLVLPERPAAVDVPPFRYWGDRKPPKNRADMFAVSTARAAAGDDTSSSDEGGGSSTGSVATMRIYGPIDSWGGWWGISAKDVAQALDELPADVTEIRVRINSPGGEAWEGMAITNLLRAHRARAVAVVDGIAASAASVIATGCDETIMSPGTQLMIHDASAFAYGPAETMAKAKRFLDSTSDAIASVYAGAAGGEVAAWRAVMIAETWYTADEAVEAGLAARVAVVKDQGETSTAGEDDEPALPDPDEVEDAFDLSIYAHAGRSKAPAPKPPTASAEGSHPTTPTTKEEKLVDFTDEQIAKLRQQLGFPEDADAATITAAVTEALTERADPPAADDTPKIPDGHVVIPAAKLADLEAGAAQASSTAKKLATDERNAFLDSVRNKYAPTNREAWEKEYDRDPEGTRKHFASAPELIPTSELGGGGEPETDDPFAGLSDAELEAFAASIGTTKEALRG